MATINHFEDLDIWQKSRVLCKNIFLKTQNYDFAKDFSLKDQIKRSSGSVMDNIAEGFERGTRAEFIQFLGYSKGSCGELRSQLYRILDRGYVVKDQFDELYSMLIRISLMLQRFIRYLQKTTIQGERKGFRSE